MVKNILPVIRINQLITSGIACPPEHGREDHAESDSKRALPVAFF